MVRSTPHAHTDFVDGRSSADWMVLAAIGKGFSSLGFSEHGMQPFDTSYSLSSEADRMYRAQVRWLRERYRKDIAVYLGIERDMYSTAERSDYQYVIGSAHYLALGDEMVAVDGPPDRVDALVKEQFGGDGQRYIEAYFEAFAGYIEGYRPDIIGHVDLIRKNNRGHIYFDPGSESYLRVAKEALHRMAPSGALLEVNTGAMARQYLKTPYPHFALLREWRDLGGRVILSTDCHDAALIDYGLTVAEDLVREAGYSAVWALNPDLDGELFVESPL